MNHTQQKTIIYTMKNPLNCNEIITNFLNVFDTNKKHKCSIHLLDGDFNTIRLTLTSNDTTDLFEDIIKVEHKNKQTTKPRWNSVGFISCNNENLLFTIQRMPNIKKVHDEIMYLSNQIYWTLHDCNNNFVTSLHNYQHKTHKCAFCNSNIGLQLHIGCNACYKIWKNIL